MWTRARCKEKKEIRVIELVESTIELYKIEKFDNITISKIAKSAKWTRSNFYKYYKTKEEVFLDVILFLFDEWADTVEKNLNTKRELTPYSFSNLWIESFEKNHMFTTLLCLCSSLIEEHSSMNKVISFKKELLMKMTKIALILKDKTNAEEKDLHKFLVAQSAIIQGGYSYFKISDFKKEVMKEIKSPITPNDAKEILVESLELISNNYLFKY